MPIAGEVIFRDRQEIVASLISEWQQLVPDVYMGLDGNLRLLIETLSGVNESAFLAMQILSDDMFVTSANLTALYRHGDQYGVYPKAGTPAVGLVTFSGAGGTYIPVGTEVAYESIPGSGKYFFATVEEGTIPNPGIPTAPTAVDSGIAGNPSGTLQYAISFVTPEGETMIGAASSTIVVPVAHKIDLSDIPLGGPGTTGRNIYRKKGSGNFLFVTSLSDNTTTTYQDNIGEGSLGSVAPSVSAVESVTIPVESEESGGRYNLAPGSITIPINTPDGVTDVTNPDYFTGGSDPELIEAFRARVLAALRNPGTGSAADLKSWAEMHNGVESATVFSNDNLGTPAAGNTTVRLSGPGGSIPTADVIDEVQVDLDGRDIANVIIHVASFTPDVLDVDVSVAIASGYTLDEITPTVETAVAGYIESLQVGETFYRMGAVDAVFGLTGIVDVDVTSPVGNVTTVSGSKKVPGTITVSTI